MKARILGLLAAALLAGPMAANAGFIIDTNGPDEFDGTFSFSNPPALSTEVIYSTGGLLPGLKTDGLTGARELQAVEGGHRTGIAFCPVGGPPR